jgi:hypothetical protein
MAEPDVSAISTPQLPIRGEKKRAFPAHSAGYSSGTGEAAKRAFYVYHKLYFARGHDFSSVIFWIWHPLTRTACQIEKKKTMNNYQHVCDSNSSLTLGRSE